MNILLAVDGSPYTQKMLAYLTSHPEILGSAHSYSAITVQPQLPARARRPGQGRGGRVLRRGVDQGAGPRVQLPAEHGVQAARLSKVGPIADSIIKAAEEGKFDLLVMGTHGHGTLGRLVMGSVSTQVLAGSQVPVLLIR
ncbi:universal stress protein [Delftia lacustris]|uniref:universal stress protein n=1 Tax=Delftia lacustris TaxID=558537 RepID=UPI00193C26BE|nr:universal stress protein [Delftia lacustris]QRI90693.1 universal stress protein [Delftia lacustris]